MTDDAIELGAFVAQWMARGVMTPAWVRDAIGRGAVAIRLCGRWSVFMPRKRREVRLEC